jgi:hypothetical protein
MIKDGVWKTCNQTDQIGKLRLVVDMSLFVYLEGKDKGHTPLGCLEFYTLPGRTSAAQCSRAKADDQHRFSCEVANHWPS